MRSYQSGQSISLNQNWIPSPGVLYKSYKAEAIVPISEDDANLIAMLEADSSIRKYRSVKSDLADEVDYESERFVCYQAEHLLGRTVFRLESESNLLNNDLIKSNIDPVFCDSICRMVAVTPSSLRAEPRFSNVRQILQCRGVIMNISDRLKILAHVSNVGSAEIGECAELCQFTRNPVEAVISLVAQGQLSLDLGKAISLFSPVFYSEGSPE
jgi:hypothetical protein